MGHVTPRRNDPHNRNPPRALGQHQRPPSFARTTRRVSGYVDYSGVTRLTPFPTHIRFSPAYTNHGLTRCDPHRKLSSRARCHRLQSSPIRYPVILMSRSSPAPDHPTPSPAPEPKPPDGVHRCMQCVRGRRHPTPAALPPRALGSRLVLCLVLCGEARLLVLAPKQVAQRGGDDLLGPGRRGELLLEPRTGR